MWYVLISKGRVHNDAIKLCSKCENFAKHLIFSTNRKMETIRHNRKVFYLSKFSKCMDFLCVVNYHKGPRNSKYTVHLVNSINLARHWFKISVLWGSCYLLDVQWFSKYTDFSWPQNPRYARSCCIIYSLAMNYL